MSPGMVPALLLWAVLQGKALRPAGSRAPTSLPLPSSTYRIPRPSGGSHWRQVCPTEGSKLS